MSANINKIFQELESVAKGGLQESFLQITRGGVENEFVVNANPEGLINLAAMLLKLALSRAPNSHMNFDSYSNAEDSDAAMVVCLKQRG